MADVILELSQHPLARNLISRAKLPLSLPERLQRMQGPSVERPLEDKIVLVAGHGVMSETLARTLTRAGAQPLLASEALLPAFAGPGEAYARPAKVASAAEDEQARVHAVVFDATGFTSVRDLQQLWQVYHVWVRTIAKSGRSVILGRPPGAAANATEAAVRTALDGFNRSLAKEIGVRGATANLIYIEEGAEARASAVLRFFLSQASAFITAQSQHVSQRVRAGGEDDPWTQPLAGKVALVTGAAQGIGEATARVLADEGAHVVCLDRPEEDARLSLVARDVGGSLLLCDIMDPETPSRIASYLVERHRGVDIVVHNAGVTRDRRLARMDEQRWNSVLGINLDAPLRINAALRDGVLREGGRIVSLSSTVGIAGNDGQTNYAASKAGIMGMTRELSGELADHGITVNAIAPGFIETRMTAAVPVLVREVARRLSALGQGGLPEDVARAIAFLATPGASGVTGQVLRVCGGALIGA